MGCSSLVPDVPQRPRAIQCVNDLSACFQPNRKEDALTSPCDMVPFGANGSLGATDVKVTRRPKLQLQGADVDV